MNLNFEQTQAVQSTAPQTLVVAGPGSGKTATLAHRIVHEIGEGIAPDHIVAITYTNAAAAEIQSRVDGLLAQDPPGHPDNPTGQRVRLAGQAAKATPTAARRRGCAEAGRRARWRPAGPSAARRWNIAPGR